MIGENPSNTDAHNKYVLALRNTLLREELSREKNPVKGGGYQEKEMRQKVVVDKNRLLALSKDLKRAVLRNTKTPLDML